MADDDTKENAAAEVTVAVQKVMDQFLKSNMGPEGTAFCLGVCVATVLALLEKAAPDILPKDHAARIMPIFYKGMAADVLPIVVTD